MSSSSSSSSLAQQLQAYQNEKSRGKGRASFLFHSRDAMDYDIPTIYGIGLAGFTELLQRDPIAFTPFRDNLFHESWIDIDRELRNQDYNQEINRLVQQFCYVLIPYVSLRASHKCIEWLIRRYKAHVYNVDALMSMILPHADTAIFSRLIQIIEITNPQSTTQGNGSSSLPLWQFLQNNVSTGTPLPRAVLAKQCLKDPGVLRFICDITSEAVNIEYQAKQRQQQQSSSSTKNSNNNNRSSSSMLIDDNGNTDSTFTSSSASTILTWYTLNITEMLTLVTANHPQLESVFSLLLPFIGKGLKDNHVAPYRIATYTITITLLSKLVITQKVFTALIQNSIQGILRSREYEPNQHFLTFLIAIFTSQGYFQGLSSGTNSSLFSSSSSSASQWLNNFQFPSRSLHTLLRIPQFITILTDIAHHHDITLFLKCFLTSGILHILQVPGDVKEIRSLLTKLPSSTTVEPLVPILVRFILSRYTAIRHGTLKLKNDYSSLAHDENEEGTMDDFVTLPDEGAAIDALGTLLRYFGQSFGTATDNGIKMLMNTRRKRSSSVTMDVAGNDPTTTLVVTSSPSSLTSPTNTLSRVGLDSDATESVNWASTILAGTDLTPISLTTDQTNMDIDGSVHTKSSIASLRYALSHASVVVRERAMNHIHQEAEQISKSLYPTTPRSKSSTTIVTDAQLSSVAVPLQTITHALDRALQDDEARVVLAALRTHTLLVQQGILAVPVPVEAKAVHLLYTLLTIYYDWLPRITLTTNRTDETSTEKSKEKGTEINRLLVEIIVFIGDTLFPLLHHTTTEDVSSVAVRYYGRVLFSLLPVSSEKLTNVNKFTSTTIVTEPSLNDVRLIAFVYAQKLPKFSLFARLASVPYPTVTDNTVTSFDLSNHLGSILVDSLQRSPSSSIVGLPAHGLVLLKEIMELVQPSPASVAYSSSSLLTGTGAELSTRFTALSTTVPLRSKWHALVIMDTAVTLIHASVTDSAKSSTKNASLLALKECIDQLVPLLRQEWLQLCNANASLTLTKRSKQNNNPNLQGLSLPSNSSATLSHLKNVFDESIDKEPFVDIIVLTKQIKQGNDNAYHTLANMHSRLRAQTTFLVQSFTRITQCIVTILQNDSTTNTELASYDCLNALFNPSKVTDNIPSNVSSTSNEYSALIIRILLLFLSTPTEAVTWESIAACSLPLLKVCGDMSGVSRLPMITTTNEILSSPLRVLITLAAMSTATYESRKRLEVGLGNSLATENTNSASNDLSTMDHIYRKIDHLVPLSVATRALELARVYFSSTSAQWSTVASATSSTVIYHTLVHCILPYLYLCCFDTRTDETATVFRGHAVSLMNEIAYFVNQGLQENSKQNKIGSTNNTTALQSVLSNNVTSMYGSPTNDSTVSSLVSTYSNPSNTITLLLLAKSLVNAADVVVMDGTLARKVFMDTVKDVADTIIPLLLSHAMISNTTRTDITAFWLQMIKSNIFKEEHSTGNSNSSTATDPVLILSLWPMLQHILVHGIDSVTGSASIGNGVSCNWGMYSSIVTTLGIILRIPYRINHSLHTNENSLMNESNTPTKSKNSGKTLPTDESITSMMMIAPAIVRLLIRLFGISTNLQLYPTGYAVTSTHAILPNTLKFVETTSFMEKSNQAISSSDVPSAGIQLVQAAIACITPVFWQFVCYDANTTGTSSSSGKANTNTSTSSSSSSSSSSTVDLLFEALVAVVAKGAPQAASMARHTLGRVRIPGIIVVRYMRKYGLCCDTLPSSSVASNNNPSLTNSLNGIDLGPTFRYRNNVTLMLPSYGSSIVQAMAWIRRLTVLVEVLVTAQNNGNPSNPSTVTNTTTSHVLGQPILLPSLFSSLEMIIALSHLLPTLRTNGSVNLFGSSSSTASNPSSSPTLSSLSSSSSSSAATALNNKVWEDEDVDSSIEYVKQLVSTAAHFATCTLPSANDMNRTNTKDSNNNGTKNDGTITTAITALDAQVPIHVIHTCNSTQTRSAALLLLSSMATVIPDTVLQQLMPVFWMVGSATLARDDAFSFHTMQRLVEAIVPSLRIYGPAVGVPIPALLKVFAICIHRIPLHRQKPLYSSLLMTAAGGSTSDGSTPTIVPSTTESSSTAAVDKARYLPAMTALLLVQHVLSREKVTTGSHTNTNAFDSSTMINLDSILPMVQDHQSVTSKGSGGNSTDTTEDASSLGPIPDVCASLLHRYSPQQQVKCLYTLLALAVKLMESPSTVVNSSPSGKGLSNGNSSHANVSNDSPMNTNDIQQLWPYLLTTGIPNTTITTNLKDTSGNGSSSSSAVPDNLPLTPAQRCAIGLIFIRFVSAHMSSKEFMGPALNVTTVASNKLLKSLTGSTNTVATPTTNPATSDRMAKACLLLSERVFDVLQLASVSWRTAEAARLSQLQRIQGNEAINTSISTNDTSNTSLSGSTNSKPSTLASSSSNRREIQEAKRAIASLSSLQRFWHSVEDITYTVLDRLSILLPPAAFVAVVSSLLQHSDSSVRRRSLLFLSDYLRTSYSEPLSIDTTLHSSVPIPGTKDSSTIDETEVLLFLQLIPDLLTLIKNDHYSDDSGNGNDTQRNHEFNENRSTAIETVTLLAAHFAKGHVTMFKDAIHTIVTLINTPVVSNDNTKKSLPLDIRAVSFISLAKLCFYVGPIAVPHLPVFIPKLLEAVEWTLNSNGTNDTNSVSALLLSNKSSIPVSASSVIALRKSILQAIQYLCNTFATFLSPFLTRILRCLMDPIILGPLPSPPSHVRYDKRITIDSQGIPTIRSPGLDGKYTNTFKNSSNTTVTAKGSKHKKETIVNSVPIVQYEPKAKLPLFLTKEMKAAANLYTVQGKPTTNGASVSVSGGSMSSTDPTVFEFDEEIYTLSQTILYSLPQKMESRILLPVLLDTYKWASDASTVSYDTTTVSSFCSGTQILLYTLNYASHRSALLLRTLSLLITKLSTTEIKDNLLRLTRFYLSVGDYRWRGLANMSTVLTTLADTNTETMNNTNGTKEKKKQRTTTVSTDTLSKEDAALIFSSHGLNASVIETELVTYFISIIVRLGDKQLRPLLQKLLTWSSMNIEDIGPELTSLGEDIDNDLFLATEETSNNTSLSSSSGNVNHQQQQQQSNSFYWTYASLCRRIVLYRSLEGLITVTRSLFIPYMSMFISAIGQELFASSKVKVNTNLPATTSTNVTPFSSASSSSKKRVQFGTTKDSMDTDENSEDNDSDSDDSDNDHPQSSTTATATNMYTLFSFLDYLRWNPTVVHGDGGNVSTNSTMTSHTVPHICIPSTPHVLRCLVLGTLLRTLAYDTNTDTSFLTQGGDKVTKEKLDLFLQPLVQQYELPLSGIKYSGSNNGKGNTNNNGNNNEKIGTKRSIDTLSSTSSLSSSTVQYFTGSMEPWDTVNEPWYSANNGASSSSFPSPLLVPGIGGGYNGYFLFVNTYLLPCIGSLVLALRKDIFWKSVNNKLLLLTRDNQHSRIRLASLQSITELFNRGGDEALVLLPETLPFLSELQHDTAREVQTECHNLLHYLEEASGEDLSEYL